MILTVTLSTHVSVPLPLSLDLLNYQPRPPKSTVRTEMIEKELAWALGTASSNRFLFFPWSLNCQEATLLSGFWDHRKYFVRLCTWDSLFVEWFIPLYLSHHLSFLKLITLISKSPKWHTQKIFCQMREGMQSQVWAKHALIEILSHSAQRVDRVPFIFPSFPHRYLMLLVSFTSGANCSTEAQHPGLHT